MPSTDETEHPPSLRQILLPVDGTPNSEVMVDWALSEFCRKGDQINLLHVIPKCVVHYQLPLDSIRPRVRARAPRTPRLSSQTLDRHRARGSERDDDTRHPIASSARRYAPSSTMYGFEEYVIDVPDPEQVRLLMYLSHFVRTKRGETFFVSPFVS
jgi:nucleotide-binding universal stress UspA family protein